MAVILVRSRLITTRSDCFAAFLRLSSIVFLLFPRIFLISQYCLVLTICISGVRLALRGTNRISLWNFCAKIRATFSSYLSGCGFTVIGINTLNWFVCVCFVLIVVIVS